MNCVQLLKTCVDCETYSICIKKAAYRGRTSWKYQQPIGRGHVTISFNETDQPVEWYESQFSGIWIGTFKNGRDDSILHTVEVAKYPVVAGAYEEDMEMAEEDLQSWIDAAGL